MPDLAKLNSHEFGIVFATECPCLSFDPKGEPLSGSDPFDKTIPRVWGRFFFDPGWNDLALRTARRIEAEIQKVPEPDRKFYYLSQIKNKYALMEFHTHTPLCPWAEGPNAREAGPGWDEAVCDAISRIEKEAHEESYGICEDCGKPGHARSYGWEKNHCDDCYDPEEEAAAERSMYGE